MTQADANQLMANLAMGKPVAAVVLVGEDLYLREMCRRALMEASMAERARQWGVARFSLADVRVDRVLQQAETLPMLTPRQVVFVEDIDAIESLGEAAREETVESLRAYLEKPAPFTVLVLEAEKLDQRTRLFKMLSEHALMVSVELSGDKDEDRRRAGAIEAAKHMVGEMARDAGVKIDAEAADELTSILNGELARIRTELEKLATYVGVRRHITLPDVDALVVSEERYSVWQLANMLATRDRKRALSFLDSLIREGETLPGLLGALAWMYRKLIEAQEVSGTLNRFQLAGRLRMRPDTAELALRNAKRIPRAQLLAGLGALYEADSRLKSGGKEADKRFVAEFLLTRLTA